MIEINIKDKKIIEILSNNANYINPISSIRYSYAQSNVNNSSIVAFYLTYNHTHLIAGKISDIRVNGTQMTSDNIDELLSDLFFLEIEIDDVNGLKTALENKADLVDGYVPSYQLPSYVDDVIEGQLVDNTQFDVEGFIILPERGKIYVDTTTNLTYRWSGSIYVEVSKSLALGYTEFTAFRGDYGQSAYNHSQMTSGNPHKVTKADIGLSNVDNISDVNKPVSTLQQAAINKAVSSIRIGVRNYVLGSKVINQPSSSTNPHNLYALKLSKNMQANTTYTLSIGKTEVIQGSEITRFEIKVYDLSTNSQDQLFFFPISVEQQSVTFTTGNLPSDGYTLLLYTGTWGNSANRAMRWTEVKLEKSNKVSDWLPAPEDIEAQLKSLSDRITALGG